jgi:hypothetical protein
MHWFRNSVEIYALVQPFYLIGGAEEAEEDISTFKSYIIYPMDRDMVFRQAHLYMTFMS